MINQDVPYRSFLLRIWRSGPAATPTWRASLEDTRTGERRGFATLALALAFLEQETQGQAAKGHEPKRADR